MLIKNWYLAITLVIFSSLSSFFISYAKFDICSLHLTSLSLKYQLKLINYVDCALFHELQKSRISTICFQWPLFDCWINFQLCKFSVVTLCFVLMFVFMCESDFKKLKFVQLWAPLISLLGAFRANKGKYVWIYTKTKKLINAFILSENSWLR